jgi:hypothetical protein
MTLRDTIGRPLINDVYWHDDAWHDVVASCCLGPFDDMRDGVFKGDESRHQIG